MGPWVFSVRGLHITQSIPRIGNDKVSGVPKKRAFVPLKVEYLHVFFHLFLGQDTDFYGTKAHLFLGRLISMISNNLQYV